MAAQTLVVAVPSKGRLQEQVSSYLADAGLNLRQVAGARDYRATLEGQPAVDVKLMSSAEIAAALGSGEVHLGIAGEDLIREDVRDSDESILLLQPLGFGFADVVVAVPRAWIDVATMADLDDVCTAFHARHHRRLRVATKYLQLTRAFFAAHGISDYRIVESLGATEGAPAAGLAEAIVDITTTGATLAANDLKVLDDGLILKSQAQLAASLRAPWTKAALEAADRLTARIAARELARSSYVLRLALPRSRGNIVRALEKDCGCSALSRSGAETVVLCPRSRLSEVVAVLRAKGFKAPVAAEHADYVFAEINRLTDRLKQALKRSAE
jgi:ATP phosphoribosyltransferase